MQNTKNYASCHSKNHSIIFHIDSPKFRQKTIKLFNIIISQYSLNTKQFKLFLIISKKFLRQNLIIFKTAINIELRLQDIWLI